MLKEKAFQIFNQKNRSPNPAERIGRVGYGKGLDNLTIFVMNYILGLRFINSFIGTNATIKFIFFDKIN